jgi:hypothetical protein
MRGFSFYGGRRNVWLLYVIILIGGFYWCREILSRLPEDINTFKQGANRAEKLVTLIYWAITVVVMALMAYSAWALAVKIIDFGK